MGTMWVFYQTSTAQSKQIFFDNAQCKAVTRFNFCKLHVHGPWSSLASACS